MFNFQGLLQMAAQAMMRKLVANDDLFNQWQQFSQQWGVRRTSRADFDGLVNRFNNTDAQDKLKQLQDAQNNLGNILK